MNLAKSITTAFELPDDICLNIPKTVLIGNTQVYVENYTALAEYKKENIKLKFKTGIIDISGNDFEIKSIGEGSILICGKISAIKFI